jgi:hypothetical protein
MILMVVFKKHGFFNTLLGRSNAALGRLGLEVPEDCWSKLVKGRP